MFRTRFTWAALAWSVGVGCATPPPTVVRSTVTLLHFADYHSHARPFYAHGTAGVGGIARAIGYLRPWSQRSDALVLSGGDMLNHGAPTWSDRYGCAEWPWLNGIVSAMAYGNHDADNGTAVFARCRASAGYPLLGANVREASGAPVFAWEGHDDAVFTVGGVRIGVFALAGSDFDRLVTPEHRPAVGAVFTDRVAAARAVVTDLRTRANVAAVVLLGHAHRDEDFALAREVPGIDVILGTHSHLQVELQPIPGTHTWYIAPYQYLEYISRVELAFTDGNLTAVTGGLVRMDPSLPEDPEVAARVQRMYDDMAADPVDGARFRTVGALPMALDTDGELTRDAPLPDLVLDTARASLHLHALVATASTFREPVAPGPVTDDDLLRAMPYPNTVQTLGMTGAQLQALLDAGVARRGTDFFLQVAGLRFRVRDGHATDIRVLRDPTDPAGGFVPLDPAETYRVGTTDFVTGVAYRTELAGIAATPTDTRLREVLHDAVAAGVGRSTHDRRIDDGGP